MLGLDLAEKPDIRGINEIRIVSSVEEARFEEICSENTLTRSIRGVEGLTVLNLTRISRGGSIEQLTIRRSL